MKEYEKETHRVITKISPNYRIKPYIPVTVIGHYQDDMVFGGVEFYIDKVIYPNGKEANIKRLDDDIWEDLWYRTENHEKKELIEGKTEFVPDDSFYESKLKQLYYEI